MSSTSWRPMSLTVSYVEYRSLVERLGDRAGDFWSIYSHSFHYDDLRPMRLLKIPLGELPQVRPGIWSYSILGSQMPLDRLYTPSRPAALVYTSVSCLPSSRTTSIELIYGKRSSALRANGEHVRKIVVLETNV